jgi:hypothetical protein
VPLSTVQSIVYLERDIDRSSDRLGRASERTLVRNNYQMLRSGWVSGDGETAGNYSHRVAYEHLGLRRWPFPTVPEPDFCTFIADRSQLRGDLETLLSGFMRQDTSDIHLLWSWFGAGKTHTLYYLANRCSQTRHSMGSRLYSMYSEFPKAPKSFVDVYRSFALGLEMDELIDAYLEVNTSPDSTLLLRDFMSTSPDLVTAMNVMTSGEFHDQQIALRWLRGEALSAAQFRSVGIQQKIANPEEASRVMAGLVRLMSLASKSQHRPGCRVIWLLDEFQRIEQLTVRLRDEINVGLHSTFNACPSGLSIILSFSGSPKPELPGYFTNEMRDRIGLTKVMILPPLQKDEAMVFISDLLKELRTLEAFGKPALFPFNEDSCHSIIDWTATQAELKPRMLMQAFDAVLNAADSKLQLHELDEVDVDFAKKVLSEHVSLAVREPED